LNSKSVLITGAARRLGSVIARTLHAEGYNVIVHYRHSVNEARSLCDALDRVRGNCARAVRADLVDVRSVERLVSEAAACWEGLDALINNASAFYPTRVGETTEQHWDDLLASNLKAPFFLAQAAAPWLRRRAGCIVNIVDIHAERPLKGYPVYSVSKAGLAALTAALAKELAPDVRVNGVSPGAILWPERAMSAAKKAEIVEQIPLQRIGRPEDIGRAVLFLLRDAPYVTGQVLSVDGGRSLFS
jgi:pteridine reductase